MIDQTNIASYPAHKGDCHCPSCRPDLYPEPELSAPYDGPRCIDCNERLVDKFHTGLFFHATTCPGPQGVQVTGPSAETPDPLAWLDDIIVEQRRIMASYGYSPEMLSDAAEFEERYATEAEL